MEWSKQFNGRSRDDLLQQFRKKAMACNVTQPFWDATTVVVQTTRYHCHWLIFSQNFGWITAKIDNFLCLGKKNQDQRIKNKKIRIKERKFSSLWMEKHWLMSMQWMEKCESFTYTTGNYTSYFVFVVKICDRWKKVKEEKCFFFCRYLYPMIHSSRMKMSNFRCGLSAILLELKSLGTVWTEKPHGVFTEGVFM